MAARLSIAGIFAAAAASTAAAAAAAAATSSFAAASTSSFSAAAAAAASPVSISLDGSTALHTFDGHGALSAGASSRLLWDYPEPQRSEVLDYLFKPNFGMGLQILKVEIGGDAQSTDGTEPSHEHTRGDLSCTRGYELFLIQEGLKRNPALITYGLSWGTPGWVGNNTFYSAENIAYQVQWMTCIREQAGKAVDYMGEPERHETPIPDPSSRAHAFSSQSSSSFSSSSPFSSSFPSSLSVSRSVEREAAGRRGLCPLAPRGNGRRRLCRLEDHRHGRRLRRRGGAARQRERQLPRRRCRRRAALSLQ
jgi:hypothetical protein